MLYQQEMIQEKDNTVICSMKIINIMRHSYVPPMLKLYIHTYVYAYMYAGVYTHTHIIYTRTGMATH